MTYALKRKKKRQQQQNLCHCDWRNINFREKKELEYSRRTSSFNLVCLVFDFREIQAADLITCIFSTTQKVKYFVITSSTSSSTVAVAEFDSEYIKQRSIYWLVMNDLFQNAPVIFRKQLLWVTITELGDDELL